MKYLLSTMSGDQELKRKHGVEHDFESNCLWEDAPGEYYTISFDSLHDLREFCEGDGEYDVVISHTLPTKLGNENYDDVDGMLTIIDGNYIAVPHDDSIRYF